MNNNCNAARAVAPFACVGEKLTVSSKFFRSCTSPGAQRVEKKVERRNAGGAAENRFCIPRTRIFSCRNPAKHRPRPAGLVKFNQSRTLGAICDNVGQCRLWFAANRWRRRRSTELSRLWRCARHHNGGLRKAVQQRARGGRRGEPRPGLSVLPVILAVPSSGARSAGRSAPVKEICRSWL